jgi:hypothetical protein
MARHVQITQRNQKNGNSSGKGASTKIWGAFLFAPLTPQVTD